MTNGALVFLLMTLMTGSEFAGVPDFAVCKSTYALCTTALCKPIPGDTKSSRAK